MKKKIGLLAGLLVIFATGCTGPSIVNKAVVQLSDNLETITVSLLFANNIQEDISQIMTVGNYGSLFIDPYTPTEPFQVGFVLNTSIFNDQNYVTLTPTEVLPNGAPIGIGYALAQVSSPSPISSKFDLYAYIDVKHTSWLGVAAMFNFLNDKNFQEGLSIDQVLKRDKANNPEIMATVFGPVVNSDGSLKKPGGISVFANVRELIAGGLSPAHALTLIPTSGSEISVLK